MASPSSYVICTSPRSGSTLLCKLLASTGVAGNPASYFHRPSVSSWCEALGLTPDDSISERHLLARVLRAAIAEGTGNTARFGLRLQRESFDFFAQKLSHLHPEFSYDAARIDAAFGPTLFIHLTRQDKVEQAVSHVKAEQTGLWHMASDGTELERIHEPRELTYDPDLIRARVNELTGYDHQWESWFKAQEITPLRVTYETLSSDPTWTLGRVLDHLGLAAEAANGVQPAVAKLADDTSKEWAMRFRSET